MITPEIKDQILTQLVIQTGMHKSFDIAADSAGFGVSSREFDAILDQMVEMNLITCLRAMGKVRVSISAAAHDFYRRGGFTAQELILKSNIEKLNLELKQLSKELAPDRLAVIDRLSAICSAITSALTYFK